MASKRGNRGSAKCKRVYNDESYKIQFDENNLPYGDNIGRFMSWFGLKCRTLMPYHVELKETDDTVYDQLWLTTKDRWNIPDDRARKVMMKRAINCWRNFKCTLVRMFVRKGITPFEKYKFLDRDRWKEFVNKKTSAKFLAQS